MNASDLPELVTERARVVQLDADTAWVHCESQAGCARCAAGEGCGAGLFAKLLRGRLQELPVTLPPALANRLAVGDTVLIGLSAVAVQTASFLLYGLPLAGVLLGAVCGGVALAGDAGALAGATGGLAGGFWLARRHGGRLAGAGVLQPVLLERLAPGEPCPASREARQ